MFNARQFCIVTKVCILTAFHSSSDKLSLEVVYDEFFWDRKWGIQKKKKKGCPDSRTLALFCFGMKMRPCEL